MKEELRKGLTEEQIAKVKACKGKEELLELAKKEGVELTDEQLQAVAGGACSTFRCPRCHSSNVEMLSYLEDLYHCKNCNLQWTSYELEQARKRR